MYTIPKDLITEWDNAKKSVAKISSLPTQGLVAAAEKKKLQEQATKLVATFDQGLKAKMKVAANAKTDADARKAAAEVAKVAADYKKNLETAAAKWKQKNVVASDVIVKQLSPVLQKISLHALASTKSRAPITFTKQLQKVQDDFSSGMTAALQRISNLNIDDEQKPAVTASLKKLTDAVQLKLKPAYNSAKNAASEDGLRTAMEELRRSLDVFRRKVYDDTAHVIPSDSAQIIMQTEFEELFIGARNRIGELIVQLDKATR
jgi:enoyl reductase-like protein